MSMTREEAIKWLEETIQDTDIYWESCSEALQKELDEQKKVFLLALSALRPVTREQVEKVWRGCDFCKIELDDYPYIVAHSDYSSSDTCYEPSFCPICGKPLTDEAVEMVIERLEALRDE